MDGLAPSTAAYTDFARLGELRRNTPENLRAAAEQFESLFVDLWMRSQRAATDALGGGLLDSHALSVHQEMLDHQWAIHLAQNGSLGIAEAVVRQFQGIVRDPSRPRVEARVTEAPRRKALPATAGAAIAAPVRSPLFASAEVFVQQVMPVVRKIARASGLSPIGIAAQAALETGWGKRVIGLPQGGSSHNLFGLKANGSWRGPKVRVTSAEVVDGRPIAVPSEFRVYDDIAASVSDLITHLKSNPRYAAVLRDGGTPGGYARALQRAGYASDPNYARKIDAIVVSPIFQGMEG